MTKALSRDKPQSPDETKTNLSGLLLISMPGLSDSDFENAVILLCQHDDEHAFGLVLNHQIEDISLKEVFSGIEFNQEISMENFNDFSEQPVFRGGPVDKGRGFVLHSLDYQLDHSTIIINTDSQRDIPPALSCALTSSRDILVDIINAKGPKQSRLSLGYAGWGPGQLETELARNLWLLAPATDEIVFETKIETIRPKALNQLGIDPHHLSSQSGTA